MCSSKLFRKVVPCLISDPGLKQVSIRGVRRSAESHSFSSRRMLECSIIRVDYQGIVSYLRYPVINPYFT